MHYIHCFTHCLRITAKGAYGHVSLTSFSLCCRVLTCLLCPSATPRSNPKGHSAAGVTSRALCSGLCLWLLLRQWRRRKAHQKGMDLQMMRDLSGLPPIDLDKLDRDLRSPRIHVVSGRIHGCTEAMAVGMPSCLRARARALLGVEAACAHVCGGVRACVWCCTAAVFGRSFRRQRICASPS